MASVGGTLGLFIGFSVFDMFSIIIDTIFNRIYAKNEWSLINMDVILSNIFNFLHKDLILELITLSKQSRDNSQLLNISSEKTTITISKLLSYYSFEKSKKGNQQSPQNCHKIAQKSLKKHQWKVTFAIQWSAESSIGISQWLKPARAPHTQYNNFNLFIRCRPNKWANSRTDLWNTEVFLNMPMQFFEEIHMP